jgi:hypothetical protein
MSSKNKKVLVLNTNPDIVRLRADSESEEMSWLPKNGAMDVSESLVSSLPAGVIVLPSTPKANLKSE